MKKTMIIMAAALMSLAACTEKIEPANPVTDPETTGGLKYITVNIEEPDTKVGIDKTATSIKFSWENGDIVYLVPNEAGNSTSYEYAYNAATEKFVATSTAAPANVNGYYAVKHPYNLSFNTASGINAAFEIALENSFTSLQSALGSIPMISEASTSGEYTLHHICGLLEVPVKTSSGTPYIYESYLAYDEANKLNKTVRFSPADYADHTKYVNIGSLTSYAYFNPAETSVGSLPLSTTTPTSMYFPIVPGEYSSGELRLYLEVANNSSDPFNTFSKQFTKTLTSTVPLKISRGKITKTSAITFAPDANYIFTQIPLPLYPGRTGNLIAAKFGDNTWAPTYTSSVSSVMTITNANTGEFAIPATYTNGTTEIKASDGTNSVVKTLNYELGFLISSGNYWYADNGANHTLNAALTVPGTYSICCGASDPIGSGIYTLDSSLITVWASSDTSVATISATSGNSGINISIKKAGTTTISCKCNGTTIDIVLIVE